MKSRLALIKVGGSFITDKSTPYTAKQRHIEQFAKQFAEVWRQYHGSTDFILDNGTGSFGHTAVNQYGLRNGAFSPKQFYGMAVTHNFVVYLNNLVANALTAQQVPVFSASPGTLMTYKDGALDTLYLDSIALLLKMGCIPLLHGDGVPDSSRGVTIISSEQVLQDCLDRLHTTYKQITVIYIMDTDGVLDTQARTIPELARDQEFTVLTQNGHDVTGSIMSKVANAREAAALADAVYLIGGHEEGALLRAIRHETVGTRVYP